MSALPHDTDPVDVLQELRPTLGSRAIDLVVSGVMLLLAWSMIFPLSGGTTAFSLFLAGFFTLGGVHYLRRTVSGKPRLEWDEERLIDRTSMIGGDLEIPWSDVQEISVSKVNGGIHLHFIDHPSVDRGMGLGRRIQRVILRLRGIPGLEINPSFLSVDYRVLGATLERLLLDFELRRVTALPDPSTAGLLPGGDSDSGSSATGSSES